MTTLIDAAPPLFSVGPRSQAMARSEVAKVSKITGIKRRTGSLLLPL